MSYKYFMKGAVCALIERDNKFLLMKRANTGYFDGFWAIPGGKLDPGETMVEGAFREVHEELGIPNYVGENLSFSNVNMLAYHKGVTDSKTVLFSVVHFHLPYVDNPTNVEPEKCEEIRWFTRREIEAMSSTEFIPIHRFAFDKLINMELGDSEFHNFPYYEGAY